LDFGDNPINLSELFILRLVKVDNFLNFRPFLVE
jgi:hypothetical protein